MTQPMPRSQQTLKKDETVNLISADKVVKRGGRIESLEFGDDDVPGRPAIPAIGRKATAAE